MGAQQQQSRTMPSICLNCERQVEDAPRCAECQSPKILSHPELLSLTTAHMDCDAFYASVEKRDNPEIRGKPVIIGGGKRGVVSTACYIARIRGVKSAMPMFQALQKCPDAIVIPPRMEVYVEVSRKIQGMMKELTPAVEPLSLDEAFMDLSGTQRLHKAPPAIMLARLANRMERELGLTGSIGLSHNKFLAKIASDMNKPKGFSIIGKEETEGFLKGKPVSLIWGVGESTRQRLLKLGVRKFSDLLRWEQKDLIMRFGVMGDRLWHLARGIDSRKVSPRSPVKSISNETTFFSDISDPDLLDGHIWRLSQKVSDRAKAKKKAGSVITLKLKRRDHSLVTKRTSLRDPTQMAHKIYETAADLFRAAGDPGPFRLVGVGIGQITGETGADLTEDLLNPEAAVKTKAERATDKIRTRYGPAAIGTGRSLRGVTRPQAARKKSQEPKARQQPRT